MWRITEADMLSVDTAAGLKGRRRMFVDLLKFFIPQWGHFSLSRLIDSEVNLTCFISYSFNRHIRSQISCALNKDITLLCYRGYSSHVTQQGGFILATQSTILGKTIDSQWAVHLNFISEVLTFLYENKQETNSSSVPKRSANLPKFRTALFCWVEANEPFLRGSLFLLPSPKHLFTNTPGRFDQL